MYPLKKRAGDLPPTARPETHRQPPLLPAGLLTAPAGTRHHALMDPGAWTTLGTGVALVGVIVALFRDLKRDLKGDIRDLRAYVDQRFAEIDQRFKKIDQRFEKIDQRFAEIDQRFENDVNKQLADLKTCIDKRLDDFRIDIVRENAEAHRRLAEMITREIAAVNQRIDDVNRRIDDVNHRIDDVRDDLRALMPRAAAEQVAR